MRTRLGTLGRAPAASVGERLLLMAVRELDDEDRPATRRVVDRFIARLVDLCEALARIDRGAGVDAASRRAAAATVEDARWSLGFLRACGAMTPDVHRRLAAGLDVARRRIGRESIPRPALRGPGGAPG